ncbi:MAG: hypothetical protein ABEJ82_06840 [Haloplanus sp.]
MSDARRAPVRLSAVAATALALSTSLVGVAAAHSGSLRGGTRDPIAVPTWLFLLTGGSVVGVSFLLASFVTDRRLVEAVHDWHRPLLAPGRLLRVGARALAVVALALTLYVGATGPTQPLRNLAILLVWVGWWGGYVASTYLLGNTWPALNPVRAVAEAVPSLDRPYPARLGAWPSVAGLLALVWVEVVTPLADDPRLLADVVSVYVLVTVAGAVVFGAEQWFETVDPLSRALRYYGRVAPLGVTDGRIELRNPGGALPETRLEAEGEVAFVVAILFVTTYDGFVGTAAWATVARVVVGLGVPPHAVYLGAYLGGFALFYLAYRAAARVGRSAAETYRSTATVARRFAPSLLPIAAGYHLAHNLGSFLVLAPTLATVAASPFAPPFAPPRLVGLPNWFGGLELAFVLLGHLLAVWVAHATAYDVFPSRLQAIRSQYGVTAVMVCYTMISLWVVAAPYTPPPFVS